MSQTPFHPFSVPKDRPRHTNEPDCRGSKKTPLNPGIDWIGFQDRGGGHVPSRIEWTTNPKQYQEENGGGTVKPEPAAGGSRQQG